MTKKARQPVKAATKSRAKRAKLVTSRPSRLVTGALARQSKIRSFESKVIELFSDREQLDDLLSLEKSNRGVDQRQLVFAGFSDVSAQVFCSMKAVLRARESEKMYFRAYLRSQLYYANELRVIERWPGSNVELLQAGRSITFEQVEAIEKPHYGTHPLPDETSDVLSLEIEVKGPKVDTMPRVETYLSISAPRSTTNSCGISPMADMCF